MLVYFKIGNYKSIKAPIVINFNATAIDEHNDSNVFSKGKDKLLRTVLLYGSNASGKSKILDGLVFYRWSILNSATDKQSNEKIDTEPFALNTTSKNQPSFFESEFIVNKIKYRYGFEADENSIHKEWLLEVKITTTIPLFLRFKQEFEVDQKRFSEGIGLEKRTRKNALFLSVAAQWNGKQSEQIINWFDNIYTIHGMMDRHYRDETTDMLKNIKYKTVINELIRNADLGINAIHTLDVTEKVRDEILNQLPLELQDVYKERIETDLKPIFAAHNVFDDDGNIVDEEMFSLESVESEGTKKFYNLAGVFVKAVISGRLVIIDEFDARLHTLLTRAIIHLFNSSILHTEAQLFAVCHDTAILDKDLLRRDQIYFVEKDNFSATKVATLVEYKARKEAPYYKNYLDGKYGAIPFIENLEMILADDKKK